MHSSDIIILMSWSDSCIRGDDSRRLLLGSDRSLHIITMASGNLSKPANKKLNVDYER